MLHRTVSSAATTRGVRSRRALRCNCGAVVGIDFGTTTSAVAVVRNGKPTIIEDAEGKALIPSAVTYTPDGRVHVGVAAQRLAEVYPADTFTSVKRLLGRSYEEAVCTGATARLPYSIVEGRNGAAALHCPARGQDLSAEEVAAELLRHLVHRAQRSVGEPVHEAVITVPAHFSASQRVATLRAAELAGLKRTSLLQEPVAAALAAGYGRHREAADVLLVVDLGGGTLDVSVLDCFEGIMEVLATGGDSLLGGDDFTRCLADWVTGSLLNDNQRQLLQRRSDLRYALMSAADSAKLELTEHHDAPLRLPPDLAPASSLGGGGGGEGLRVSRTVFELTVVPLLNRMWGPLEDVARRTRTRYTGWPPHHVPDPFSSSFSVLEHSSPLTATHLHPVLATTTASRAPSTSHTSTSTSPSSKYTAPPRRLSGVVLVGAATAMPAVRRYIEHLTNLPAHSGEFHPQELVALGAALQGGLLRGQASGGSVELMDGSYVMELHSRASGFQV